MSQRCINNDCKTAGGGAFQRPLYNHGERYRRKDIQGVNTGVLFL